jgi:uncharacterized protein with ATP-grasp and redox domains
MYHHIELRLIFQQKKQENEQALKCLKSRLDLIDNLEGSAKLEELVRGVLIGNIFDWGAQEIATLLERNNFSFEDAKKKIPGILI